MPAKNESKNLPKLIESVDNQVFKPSLWLIFDDRSTDDTLEILKMASLKYPYIKYHSLKDFDYTYPWRYHAIMGKGFKLAPQFAEELKIDWHFIAVLDADIIIEQKSYFRDLIEIMTADPSVAISCGRIDDRIDGNIIIKKKPDNRPAGAARVVSRVLLEKIGEYPVGPSGDSISTDLAKLNGFITLRVKNNFVLQDRATNKKSGKYLGIGKYFIGMHPLTAFLFPIKLIKRSGFKDAFDFLKSYFKCYFSKHPKHHNKDILNYYRFKF